MKLLLLFIISFAPAIVYVIWIRNTEKYEREPWRAIFAAFLWGATLAIIAALLMEELLGISLATKIGNYSVYSFIMAVIIAPFAEEIAKPLGLSLGIIKREINEEEDGIIYGAIAGLGFAATENLFYSISFLSYGLLLFSILVIIRTIGGFLLHASATSFTGYGYGKAILEGKRMIDILPFFMIAMTIHSFYNFLVSFELIGGVAGVLLAIIFAISCMRYVRKKIKKLDMSGVIQ